MSTSRTRSQDSRLSTYWMTDMYRPGPLPWIGIRTFQSPIGSIGSLNVMNDNNNRPFNLKRKNGVVVMSDMSLHRWSREVSDGSLQVGPYPSDNIVVPKGGYNRMYGDLTQDVEQATRIGESPISAYEGQMKQVCLMKAYSKINPAAIVSGEILKDLDQTVGMLRRPFGNARDLLRRMAKYRNRKLGKSTTSIAKASANAWLEYRYGWQPIVLDSRAIIDEVHKKRESVGFRRLVVRAGETAEYSNSAEFVDKLVTPERKASGSTNYKQVIRVSSGVIFDLKNRTASSNLDQILGYRPRDFATTAWEMIPYSFVADWFVNVGQWLEAVTPDPDVNILGSWTTSVNTRTDNWSGGSTKWIQGNLSPTPVGTWGPSTITDVWVTRTANPEVASHPVLTVKPLSMLHSIDALALSCGRIINAIKSFRH